MKNKIFLCISFVLVMLFTSSCTDYTFEFHIKEKPKPIAEHVKTTIRNDITVAI